MCLKERFNNFFFIMKHLYNMIQDLDKEYDKILKRYYELGGTADFLEKSGIKKTFINP